MTLSSTLCSQSEPSLVPAVSGACAVIIHPLATPVLTQTGPHSFTTAPTAFKAPHRQTGQAVKANLQLPWQGEVLQLAGQSCGVPQCPPLLGAVASTGTEPGTALPLEE